ncbi:SusC/RagA family TonB-linked outer membrane protein [Flavobacterium faecale]|uniref:SusC/RagA family TonB-linked outer membrane protein n=1 Tax=Flavobacterium faecale TaxID=1355330 RepID=A0A2S1LD40_9FLAO|nr:TonB-dependent receptor [Flavobacterium faecale]AWG21673.1 SusC/RagA family TonB-linked outer membrane protein [Flavobacterium faecale]
MNQNLRNKVNLLFPFQSKVRTRSISVLFTVSCLVMHTNSHAAYSNKVTPLIKSYLDQQTPIKGTVKDSDGLPIPGVNVLIKGTTIGTTTDIDGNYILATSSTAKTLVFSYLGMKTEEVNINGKTVIDATLASDAAALSEVVVIGYGTIKKSDLTGSVASADTKELNKTQNTSIAQAIQGRLAGVTVTKSSGDPGATPTVRIRGIGTVNGADPLYVVDGVPINDISSINMADAKSVEVLKDASATAIYGSRGANGVVMITTKGGQKGAPTITYSTYASVQNRIDNLQVLNSNQWATLYNEANVNDGKPANPNLTDPSSLPNYNWKDAVYKTGTMQSHQLAVTGGGDKSTYYVSFGSVAQKGVIDQSSYKRTNFRVNNTYQIKPKIKLGTNLQYASSNTVAVPQNGFNSNLKSAFVGYIIDPVTPLYNADGSLGLSKYSLQAVSPLGLVQYGKTPSSEESFLGNVFIEAEILKGLTFKSNYGLQINTHDVNNFRPVYNVSPRFNAPVSVYSIQRNQNRVMIVSNTLNYNKQFGKKHSLNALLGQEQQILSSNSVSGQQSNIPSSVENPTVGAGDSSTSILNGGISRSELVSFFGRLNYNYDERYLLTGTYRVDGSSRFGANNKWAKFPSLAAAWNVHNEKFFHANAIDQLKLRVGWGKTGNQNIPISAVFNTLNVGTNYLYGSDNTALGVAPLTPGNQNLKWESTVSTNFGLDLGIMHNSITFSADYFIKNTTDMLMPSPILQTSGYANYPYTNAGNIQNKGLELTANYKKSIKDFYFSVGGNISFIQNKVLSLNGDGSIIQTGDSDPFYNISRTEAGHPLASFYGYQMAGIFQNQNEVNTSATLPNTKPGDVKYKDLNGDGKIDDSDKTFIGSPFPKFTYGINLDLSYKQFDFTAFFQGSQGNKIYNTTDYWLQTDISTNSSTAILDRWTGEGTSNTVPRASFASTNNNSQLSSRFVKNGSYLRLKNVQIGYSFKDDFLKKSFISKLRLYVAAQNLLTFTKYDGLDPEAGVDPSQNSPLDIGIDRGRYPSVRSYTLGLDINF